LGRSLIESAIFLLFDRRGTVAEPSLQYLKNILELEENPYDIRRVPEDRAEVLRVAKNPVAVYHIIPRAITKMPDAFGLREGDPLLELAAQRMALRSSEMGAGEREDPL
jgi:hypothetical protein